MKYRTIVADPPWPIEWRGGAARRRNGRGELHVNHRASVQELPYPTMTVEEITELGVRALSAPKAHLYLWVVDRFLLDGSAAGVVAAWGFKEPRLLIWRKGFGLGTFPRPQHEICLFASRGGLRSPLRTEGSVQDWKLVYEPTGRSHARKHSAKPDGFYDLVEMASPGPYLELFARRNRLGWATWGYDALEHVTL